MIRLATEEDDYEDDGCTWVVGSYYGDTPPEPCGREVQPDDDYCPQHQAAVNAFEQMARDHPDDSYV